MPSRSPGVSPGPPCPPEPARSLLRLLIRLLTGRASGGKMPALDHHILVVEDDTALRVALCNLLLEEGLVVSCAEDGRAGLELLQAGSRPCLILLDLQMPFLDGFGFRRRQLSDPDLADIPAVVMTAQSNKEDEARKLGI